MGVYSKKDELILYDQGIWTAASSAFVKSEKQIRIQCDTLDSIVQKLESNQKFVIKMDIEGSEYDALLGGSKTLENCRKIMRYSYASLYKKRIRNKVKRVKKRG